MSTHDDCSVAVIIVVLLSSENELLRDYVKAVPYRSNGIDHDENAPFRIDRRAYVQ